MKINISLTNPPNSNLTPSLNLSFIFLSYENFSFHFPPNSQTKPKPQISPTSISSFSLISTSLFNPSNQLLPWRTKLSFRTEDRASSRKMEFHGYSVSVPPPPLTAVKAPAAEKIGIERELVCLVSSYDGGKRSESEVQAEDRAAMEDSAAAAEEESGRERLKRHRREIAGRVWIPEIWGQEELLKDWIDCSAFDASLFPTGIGSARAALVDEGRRANNGGFRLENRC